MHVKYCVLVRMSVINFVLIIKNLCDMPENHLSACMWLHLNAHIYLPVYLDHFHHSVIYM